MADFDHRLVLIAAYAAFNARAIDAALATMHPDIDWPNGWKGGRVIGHDAIRAYWTQQWEELNPHVEPQRCTTDDDGRVTVDVHQVVGDYAGHTLADEQIQHIYEFENGLIKRMDIQRI
ncbi:MULTISPECIES: nuclear transport factor 2 family protein [unclassified Spirosoma]|uniref:nuclear transport factor 2 family protein n=1 Tax=unclassified Spirosoma TaxID=2621999 RepID=UPI00096160FC|nr:MULTISPECIES: nuclear transport factor 2 family protein [unclassified Spirosoma]MBN8822588.1 nuclear transport factor 2 family protein [Spirosoma sp.]OJW74082.1 MAG: ketosteroid isomerase [Spirosoma sp. 48-14]